MRDEFIEALATSAPTPGGGGASAYAGAVASALASMVGELTLGKDKYADVEEDIRDSLERLSELREELLALVDEDAAAFRPLARAYGMGSSSDEQRKAKHEAMQRALLPATEVPLRIMRACEEVLVQCSIMASKGSRLAVSDAGACAAIAKGALIAASMNVWVNVRDIDDEAVAADFRNRALGCMEIGIASADDIVSEVFAALDTPKLDFRIGYRG